MSSKVSNPGAFETSPALAAKRRSNSSTRSDGTVMALMRTTLMRPFLSPRPANRRRQEGVRASLFREMADGRAWQNGPVRGLLVPSEGKYPDAQLLRGKREDRGARDLWPRCPAW